MANADTNIQPQLATVDKLRLLLDITKTISRSLDLDEVLNLVMDTLGSLIPYDAAGIYLIEFSPEDASPYVFKSKAIRGYQISFELIEPRLRMGEGFLGTVAQSGKAIISPDANGRRPSQRWAWENVTGRPDSALKARFPRALFGLPGRHDTS